MDSKWRKQARTWQCKMDVRPIYSPATVFILSMLPALALPSLARRCFATARHSRRQIDDANVQLRWKRRFPPCGYSCCSLTYHHCRPRPRSPTTGALLSWTRPCYDPAVGVPSTNAASCQLLGFLLALCLCRCWSPLCWGEEDCHFRCPFQCLVTGGNFATNPMPTSILAITECPGKRDILAGVCSGRPHAKRVRDKMSSDGSFFLFHGQPNTPQAIRTSLSNTPCCSLLGQINIRASEMGLLISYTGMAIV